MSEARNAIPNGGIGFGPFALFPSRRLLLESGRPVGLGDRALDILTSLASRPGEVVTKQMLLAEAWPDVFVEEVNLRVHVAAVRRALGDGVDGRRFVKTVPGHGYSFVATVVPLTGPVADTPRVGPIWLPRVAGRVVGRDAIIASIVADLTGERLVSLVGPAGIGKTTVAIAAADRAHTSFIDGGAFVDLASVSDPATLPIVLSMSLGLPELRAPSVDYIAAEIRGRNMLIVVDNCEHLISAVAEALDVLLARTEHIRIIATSREPIGISGEKLRRLAALEVPAADTIRTARHARANPAIQLFEQRARAARDDFEIDDGNAPILADICRQLDGLPFAIELAASRSDRFGVAELKAQLDDHASLLDYVASRTAPPHQRSVRDALQWSYELLPESERSLLRRLSVFAGSFTLDDAVDLAATAPTPPRTIVDQLAALASKSLLAVEFRGVDARYRLLETTRIYAAERLDEDDEPRLWRRRHADLVKARLDGAQAVPTPVGSLPAAARYLPELRAALDWAFSDPSEVDTAANLTLAAVPLWTHLSLYSECRRCAASALRHLGDASKERYRDMVLRSALGTATMFCEGHTPAAVSAFSEALDSAQRFGDVEHELRALWGLWNCALNNGGYRRCLDLAREFERAAARSPLTDDALIAHRMLGSSYHYIGNPKLGRLHTETMLSRYIPSPDGRDLLRYHSDQRLMAQFVLVPVLWILGFPDQAQVLSDRNLSDAMSVDHPSTLVYAAAQHGHHCVCLTGNADAARADLRILADLAERYPWSRAQPLLDTLAGSLEARLGDAGWGVEALDEIIRRRATMGHVLQLSEAMGILAEGWRRLGKSARALEAIDAALERSERSEDLSCHADLVSRKGEILRDAGEASEAQALFEAAIGEAQAQGALGWELRAATGLARLWLDAGRTEAARQLLAAACAKYSEGFSTPDVRVAIDLLRTLG